MLDDGSTAIQSKNGNTLRRLQMQSVNDDIAYFKSTDGGATWPTIKILLTNADLVSGYTTSIDVQANTYTEVTITHNMGAAPNIVVSLQALTGQMERASALTALIQSVSSNTAVVRVFNNGSIQSSVNLYWNALRK